MNRTLVSALTLLAALVVFSAGCAERSRPRPVPPSPSASVPPGTVERTSAPAAVDPSRSGAAAVAHDLKMRLDPTEHIIDATDIITFDGKGSVSKPIVLVLSKAMKVLNLVEAGSNKLVSYTEHPLEGGEDSPFKAVCFWIKGAQPKVIISYFGKIYDPVKEPGNLRFVAGGYTRGIIGEEGIYLGRGTGWYPDTWESMARYRVEIITPAPYYAIAPGNFVGRRHEDGKTVSCYDSGMAIDGLDVVGGRYAVSEKAVGDVTVRTYFNPEDAKLAPAYIDAAAAYIKRYSELLGPYPYNRFAIVSNFFPTGYGMPGYTLLGRNVIRRMHVQEYALGHEIVHDWWGNGVFVDWEKGNWCEGLTTYCANYYWLEDTLGEDDPKVIEYRRKCLQRFKVFVNPSNDYPPIRFRGKKVETDNEVGYTKLAMMFHQLRLRVGKEKFFASLREFYSRFRGKSACWDDIRACFEDVCGVELGDFFDMWLNRVGLPVVRLAEVRSEKDGDAWMVSCTLEQGEPVWDVMLELVVTTAGGEVSKFVRFNSPSAVFTIETEDEPRLLSVDPRAHLLRDISDGEVRPCLNKTLWFGKLLVVYPTGTKHDDRYAAFVKRVTAARHAKAVSCKDFSWKDAAGFNVLFVGGMDEIGRFLSDTAHFHLSPADLVKRKLIAEAGGELEGSNIAFLASMDLPGGGTATVYSWFSDPPPPHLDRIVFFYGWYGYVVFKNGRKLLEGMLAAREAPLEHRFRLGRKKLSAGDINLLDGLSPEEARALIARLASPELGGRMTGSEGGRAAADLIAALLARNGFKPAGPDGSYFQEFEFPVYSIGKGSVKCGAVEGEGFSLGELKGSWTDGTALPLVFGGDGSLSRPAVYAGDGIVCPQLGRNPYEGFKEAELRGKVFFISASTPAGISPADRYRLRDSLSLYGRAKAAIERGAAAVVFLADRQAFLSSHYDLVTYVNYRPPLVQERYFGGPPENRPKDDRLLTANLQARCLSYGKRLDVPVLAVFPAGLPPAGKPVVLGEDLVVNVECSLEADMVKGRNVLALLPGSDAEKSLDVVILAAHYDHNGPAAEEGAYFPGANDNASGVAGVLAAAAEIQAAHPGRSVLLFFPDAEEWGLRGSRAYLEDPVVPLSRTVAMLNFDMIGRGRGREFYLVGSSCNKALGELAARAAAECEVALKTGIEHAIIGSDQWAFHLRSIPTLLLTSGRYAEMNTPADTAEKVDVEAVLAAGRLWARLAVLLDTAPRLPAPLDLYLPIPQHRLTGTNTPKDK